MSPNVMEDQLRRVVDHCSIGYPDSSLARSGNANAAPVKLLLNLLRSARTQFTMMIAERICEVRVPHLTQPHQGFKHHIRDFTLGVLMIARQIAYLYDDSFLCQIRYVCHRLQPRNILYERHARLAVEVATINAIRQSEQTALGQLVKSRFFNSS